MCIRDSYEYYKPELQAAKAAGALVTSEVELFFAFCPCEIVAVTGSDGKTTTTTLISKMLDVYKRQLKTYYTALSCVWQGARGERRRKSA